jgi:hypothetical protein
MRAERQVHLREILVQAAETAAAVVNNFMKKERRWLVNAIRAQLLPEFTRHGFEIVPLPKTKYGPTDREFVANHPFGLLRRQCARGFEQVEIHLASREGAAFSLGIGVIPIAGIQGIFGHIAADEALVTWLEEFFILYSRPRSFKPFAVRRWRWSKREVSEIDYQALVGQVVELLPEVEQALSQGKAGPHIRRTVLGGPPILKAKG